ncbi:hypothetical protein J2Z69_003189 [Paenibacillus shirakamiensis]|uniref:Uncharacterized protein n=1 Tax=Paenibacillus shirakamiensis TaxID=1265935 RepID=A0ABS4JK93_9BACL|nr:hypothetical protein [Paenibacillus shirakamiensis]MBP2002132.1 hypothetical protein [Paenibacillus shirakamiensis]
MNRVCLSEQEVKLELILSIAKSQTALARILDSLADVTDHADISAKQMEEHIRLLTDYQCAMAESLTGIRLHRKYYGTPTLPWINEALYQAAYAARGVQGEE